MNSPHSPRVFKVKRKHEGAYMNAARGFAALSKCVRLKVGACAEMNGSIIGEGFNGQPSDVDDDRCEFIDADGEFITKPDTRHAELNLALSIARSNNSAIGCTVYLTHAPCEVCAHLLKDIGVAEVVYENTYRSDAGIKVLQKAGVSTRQFKENE